MVAERQRKKAVKGGWRSKVRGQMGEKKRVMCSTGMLKLRYNNEKSCSHRPLVWEGRSQQEPLWRSKVKCCQSSLLMEVETKCCVILSRIWRRITQHTLNECQISRKCCYTENYICGRYPWNKISAEFHYKIISPYVIILLQIPEIMQILFLREHDYLRNSDLWVLLWCQGWTHPREKNTTF